MAFSIGAWGLQMHYLSYNIKLSKKQEGDKHFAFIIYFRQVGLFKIGFGIGFIWLIFTSLVSDTGLSMKTSQYRF